jgi:hypothetical protein
MGNSTKSKQGYCFKKKSIRIMTGVKRRVSCRELFKEFKILPLATEFLFSLLLFFVNNKGVVVSDIHI